MNSDLWQHVLLENFHREHAIDHGVGGKITELFLVARHAHNTFLLRIMAGQHHMLIGLLPGFCEHSTDIVSPLVRRETQRKACCPALVVDLRSSVRTLVVTDTHTRRKIYLHSLSGDHTYHCDGALGDAINAASFTSMADHTERCAGEKNRHFSLHGVPHHLRVNLQNSSISTITSKHMAIPIGKHRSTTDLLDKPHPKRWARVKPDALTRMQTMATNNGSR